MGRGMRGGEGEGEERIGLELAKGELEGKKDRNIGGKGRGKRKRGDKESEGKEGEEGNRWERRERDVKGRR